MPNDYTPTIVEVSPGLFQGVLLVKLADALGDQVTVEQRLVGAPIKDAHEAMRLTMELAAYWRLKDEIDAPL